MNSFTTNYNLDLYDVDDKPNLNDQYNDAMHKVDNALHGMSNDIVTAETAVNNLSTKVDGFDARITANATAAATAQTTAESAVDMSQEAKDAADAAQSTANTANSTATSNAASIAQIQEELADINAARKTVVTLGDSWVDRANGNFTPLVAQALDMDLENVAASGSGFTTSTPIVSQVSSIKTDPSNVSLVIVMAGVNDVRGGTTDLYTAGIQLCNTLKTKLPNARIVVYGPQNVPSVNPSLTRTAQSSLARGVQEAGCEFISMFGWFVAYTGVWDAANLHLTNTASTSILVSKILGSMYGTGSAPVRTFTPAFNTVPGLTVTANNFLCTDTYAQIDMDFTLNQSKGSQTVLCATPFGGKETYGLVTAKSSASATTYCYVGASGSLVLGEIGASTLTPFHLQLFVPFI